MSNTVDLSGVEILAADVTIRGRGSPAAGDRNSRADLAAIAEPNRELAAELRPPAKVGHEGTALPWGSSRTFASSATSS